MAAWSCARKSEGAVVRVLITRPQPDADAFAALCRKAGLAPIVAPLMSVRFQGDWAAPANAGALAFTSANGVRAFVRRSPARDLPAFCVGAATAAKARENGFQKVFTADGDVASLTALIANHASALSGPVVHIAGARRAGDLMAMLKKQNAAATRIVAYQTEEAARLPAAAQEALEAGAPLSVALFSPRTARLFLDLVAAANLTGRLTDCSAACLSGAVAETARGAEWGAVDVAHNRTSAAMVALIKLRA